MNESRTTKMRLEPGHIAIYLPSLRGGGAERVMVTLANGFVERGHRVDLILAHAEGPYLDEVEEDVRILDLKSNRVLFSLPKLAGYLRRERPDAMLSALTHANVIALMAKKIAKVETRCVVSERTNLSMSIDNSLTSRGRTLGFFVRRLYRYADTIIAVSQGVADDLTDHLINCPVQVVYNPVVDEVLVDKSYVSPSHPWFVNKDVPLFLGVGRLTPQKDFETLIRAFSLVRSKISCRLLILGEGRLRTSLENLISDLGISKDVLMPGFSENPFPWMRRASVFVLSSRVEGLPNVLIQAMACGTPVIAMDCPSGPAEILEDGRWGRLLPVGDHDALAEAMLIALQERESPNVSLRASDFSVEAAVSGYLNSLLGPLLAKEHLDGE